MVEPLPGAVLLGDRPRKLLVGDQAALDEDASDSHDESFYRCRLEAAGTRVDGRRGRLLEFRAPGVGLPRWNRRKAVIRRRGKPIRPWLSRCDPGANP